MYKMYGRIEHCRQLYVCVLEYPTRRFSTVLTAIPYGSPSNVPT